MCHKTSGQLRGFKKFMLAVIEDNLQSAEIILTQLNDNSIKTYLLFLKYSLHFLIILMYCFNHGKY